MSRVQWHPAVEVTAPSLTTGAHPAPACRAFRSTASLKPVAAGTFASEARCLLRPYCIAWVGASRQGFQRQGEPNFGQRSR